MSTDHPLTLTAAVVAAAVLVAAVATVTGVWVRRRTVAGYVTELLDIRRAAFCDPLTGLGNRAAFHRLLAAPHSRHATVILINIDGHRRHLRTIGDRAFDEAVTLIAGRIRHEAATVDAHAFRLRRDEFAVVRAAPAQHGAAHRRASTAGRDDGTAALAGRLVAAVQAATTVHRAGLPTGVRMRARAGVATAPGHTEPDGRLVLVHADLAVRFAKRTDAAWVRHPAASKG